MPWAPSYITTTELADFVRADQVIEESRLLLAVEAASRAVDDATNRQFGKEPAPVLRSYVGRVNSRICRWWAPIDDLQDMTGLVVEIGGVAVTDFRFEPVNAGPDGKPYTRIVFGPDAEATPNGTDPDIDMTAPWGWDSVPGTVKEATLLQGSRFFERMKSPFGVAGSPELGSELRLLERADPDVAVMVQKYTRDRVTIG